MLQTMPIPTDTKHLLSTRRSANVKTLQSPAPTGQELKDILSMALRVPDHKKLEPWRLIVFEGDSRIEFGDYLRQAYAEDYPEADDIKLDYVQNLFSRVPLVIGVVSSCVEHEKVPQYEQVLSAGALCMNICIAMNAHGYGTNWITDWYAYHDITRDAMGLHDFEEMAGFIYVGTEPEPREERKRPDLEDIAQYWTEYADK
jgi:nitroreductase